MSRPFPNLILVGFMGTGKSTVGPLVARALRWAFVDTDALVEQAAGMPVKDIFALRGEGVFRAMERQALREAANLEQVVMSVGGGALLDPENARTLETNGVVLLLTCECSTLARRLEDSMRRGERPLLGEDLLQSIDALLRAREPAYSRVRLKVDTTHLTPQEVATRVLTLYWRAVQAEALA